jgi:hypothetical protein
MVSRLIDQLVRFSISYISKKLAIRLWLELIYLTAVTSKYNLKIFDNMGLMLLASSDSKNE